MYLDGVGQIARLPLQDQRKSYPQTRIVIVGDAFPNAIRDGHQPMDREQQEHSHFDLIFIHRKHVSRIQSIQNATVDSPEEFSIVVPYNCDTGRQELVRHAGVLQGGMSCIARGLKEGGLCALG